MIKKLLPALILCFSCAITVWSDERSPEWNKVRDEFIRMHPVCALCGTAKDLQVHHKKPFHLYPELELDKNNLITLCISKYWGFNCHLIAGHGGCNKYENPWIDEDIEKLKIIGDPLYVKDHGIDELEQYLMFLKKRVKDYNKNQHLKSFK